MSASVPYAGCIHIEQFVRNSVCGHPRNRVADSIPARFGLAPFRDVTSSWRVGDDPVHIMGEFRHHLL